MREPATTKTKTIRRSPTPSTARKNTGRDSRGADPAMLPAPAELYGACIHLVEDIVQDFLLFKSRRKIVVAQGGFDLSYYVAYVGHGF
jgi:hypothetical protein